MIGRPRAVYAPILIPALLCAVALGQAKPTSRPTAKLADACHITIVKGLPVIETDIPSGDSIKFSDPGVDGNITISRDTDNHITGYELTINRSVDGASFADHVSTQIGSFTTLEHEESSPAGETRYFMLQVAPPGTNGFGMGRRGGMQPPLGIRFNNYGMNMRNWPIRATNFDNLIHDYPQETEQFLRPLFRDLQNEDLLPPANLEAIQVLADDIPSDPARTQKIENLVKQLDADSAEDRDAATIQLKAMHGEAIVYLIQMSRADFSPEQSARVDSICQDYKLLTPDQIKARRQDVKFLMSAAASDQPPIRAAAIKVLGQVIKQPINFDNSANPVTRSLELTELHDRLLPTVGN